MDPASPGSTTALLLSESAFRRWRDDLLGAERPIRWVAMGVDGDLNDLTTGEAQPVSSAVVEEIRIAWATADLFDAGGLGPFVSYLRQANALEWFQAAGAGTEQRIYRELAERNVCITTCHASTNALAEFVLRCVLDHFQQAGRWRQAERAGAWQRHEFREVEGSTWMIIGLGHIGRALAALASALGAQTIGVSRASDALPVDEAISRERLAERVGEADVVAVCAPLTSDTYHLVSEDVLRQMRHDALLINVGRGALIDEAALLDSLDHGRPGAAALDVFEAEPLASNHPFWSHPKVRVTPHAAGMSLRRHRRAMEQFVDNLGRWCEGSELVDQLRVGEPSRSFA